jgi:hypothetical protein
VVNGMQKPGFRGPEQQARVQQEKTYQGLDSCLLSAQMFQMGRALPVSREVGRAGSSCGQPLLWLGDCCKDSREFLDLQVMTADSCIPAACVPVLNPGKPLPSTPGHAVPSLSCCSPSASPNLACACSFPSQPCCQMGPLLFEGLWVWVLDQAHPGG